jgi:hypothetical protein
MIDNIDKNGFTVLPCAKSGRKGNARSAIIDEIVRALQKKRNEKTGWMEEENITLCINVLHGVPVQVEPKNEIIA